MSSVKGLAAKVVHAIEELMIESGGDVEYARALVTEIASEIGETEMLEEFISSFEL